jgi:cellulose synthase (UDP-forming)
MVRVRAGAVLVVLALLVVNGHRWGGLWPPPAPVAPAPVAALPAQGLAWGAYDPEGRLAGAEDLAIEQVYLPWNGDEGRLTDAVRAIRRGGRVPLVTLEPWPAVWAGLAGETLLEDVAAGRYDASIRQACTALGRESPQAVLVRWGHEMDLEVLVRRGQEPDLSDRYPWANGDAPGYVGAYRHFVATCRATGAANLSYVWSPGGDPGLQDYWPGADVVDYAGTTVLGFAEWDVAQGAGRPATFRELFDPRYRLLQAYGKPVLVCEFAATGPAEDRRRWIAEAGEAFGAYPLLKAVVSFDAVDPVAWGDLGRPDWRVPPGAFPPPAPPAGPQAVPAGG